MDSPETDLNKSADKRPNISLRLLGPGLVTGAADDDPSGWRSAASRKITRRPPGTIHRWRNLASSYSARDFREPNGQFCKRFFRTRLDRSHAERTGGRGFDTASSG